MNNAFGAGLPLSGPSFFSFSFLTIRSDSREFDDKSLNIAVTQLKTKGDT
jgi:hypothetical protein